MRESVGERDGWVGLVFLLLGWIECELIGRKGEVDDPKLH